MGINYKENNQWKEIKVKVGDNIPVGAEFDYDGQTVPVGYEEVTDIIESGNNENGNYIKYANGLLVCNQRFSRNVAISTAWGNLYRSDAISCPNYPVPFTAIYSSVCDVTGVNTALALNWGDGSFGAHGQLILLRPASAGSQPYEINIITIGTWK